MTTQEITRDRWLKCQLDKGMFSDEVAVTYPSSGTPVCSVFVPAQAVHGQLGATGKVRVRIVERQGSLLAVLPSNYSDSVRVQEQDVSDTP